MITEELRALIEAAGLTPSHSNLTQVRDAINVLAVRRSVASLQVSVAGNVLTGTLAAEALDFRSSTLADGASVTRFAPTAASLTVPNGATLGVVAGVKARLVWGWIDNAGTLEPFVANMAGGVNLDETTLISTTAISAGADSAGVIYSQVARGNVAIRVRGFCDITEATAGIWATAPTLVQGAGGQAMAALDSLGYGAAWRDLKSSRAVGTTYYNTTGRPIFVHVGMSSVTTGTAFLNVNGVQIPGSSMQGSGAYSAFGIVPPGASYVVSADAGQSVYAWIELR